jgi:hypothetical protein
MKKGTDSSGKKLAIVLIILSSVISSIAQVPDSTVKKSFRPLLGNSLYLETFGNAMGASINYERLLIRSNRSYLTGRVGLGMGVYVNMTSHDFVSIPLLLNFQYQVSNVIALEIGAGSTLSIVTSHNYFNPLITGLIGIRAQSKNGFLFKIGLTPLINLDDTFKMWGLETFYPWAGISFGYSFGK